MECYLAATAAK